MQRPVEPVTGHQNKNNLPIRLKKLAESCKRFVPKACYMRFDCYSWNRGRVQRSVTFQKASQVESKMTTFSLNPLPANPATLAANSLPVTKNSTTISLNSQGSLLAETPPIGLVPFRRLRSEPTEPPKQTLNGQNKALNGAVIFLPTHGMPGFLEIRHPKSEIQPLRILQGEPTEPPKTTLSGENQHLNGPPKPWPPTSSCFLPSFLSPSLRNFQLGKHP